MAFTSRRIGTDGNVHQRATSIDYWDLWHDQGSPLEAHEERHTYDPVRWRVAPIAQPSDDDNAAPWQLRGRGHTRDCECAGCVSARLAYECETDIEDTLEARHDRVLSIALSTDPAKSSDVLKAFHRAHVHYRDLSEAWGVPGEYGTLIMLNDRFRENCRYLASTYDKAGRVLWARMMHYAQHKSESKSRCVKHRSDPGTIGRTAVTDDNLYVCEHPECGCSGIPWSQRKRLL